MRTLAIRQSQSHPWVTVPTAQRGLRREYWTESFSAFLQKCTFPHETLPKTLPEMKQVSNKLRQPVIAH